MSKKQSKDTTESSEPMTTSSTPQKAGDDAELSPKRNDYWCNQWFSDIGWEQQNITECRYVTERVMEHTKQFSCPQLAEEWAIKLMKKALAKGGSWYGCKVRYMGPKKYAS